MRWQDSRRSTNIEDRRGIGVRGGAIGGGAIVVALVALLLGASPETIQQILGGGGDGTEVDTQPSGPRDPTQSRPDDRLADFVAVVLADTEDAWTGIFRARGETYVPPKLVLFSNAVRSACGMEDAAVGPFYCPPDRRVYLDLTFFGDLDRRFGAPGDFAQAYVVAHEVGHHVQNLLGISERAQAARARLPAAEANHVSVLTELQADCLAGVAAHHAQRARQFLEDGDVEEGLRAASAIGDDTLQRRGGRGRVSPESFTHGTSQQRVRWFRKGLEGGKLDGCDTFAAATL